MSGSLYHIRSTDTDDGERKREETKGRPGLGCAKLMRPRLLLLLLLLYVYLNQVYTVSEIIRICMRQL